MGIRSFAAELLLPASLQQRVRATPATNGAKTEVSTFAALAERLTYLGKAEAKLVREAYKFADEAHLGQFRASGEPYITHPLAVAGMVADWRLDAQAIMAALMHDAMEDCGVTKVELIERFGAPTAELVDGLTKLDKLQFSTREEGQAESFRKMLLAMARDVRVILIKLADRLHNMRTMAAMAPAKRQRIARETLDIYAPIAHRLGLNQIYRELQELAFSHLHPWRHSAVDKAVKRSPQFGHYPKSGHVANRMGRSVAQYIAQQAKGEAPRPVLIDNLCYMLVNTDPLEAISVQFDYEMGPEGHLVQKQIDDNDRRKHLWEEDLRWYGLMLQDMTGG